MPCRRLSKANGCQVIAEVDASLGGKEGAPRSGGGAAAHGGECSKPEPPSDLAADTRTEQTALMVAQRIGIHIGRREEKQRAAGIMRNVLHIIGADMKHHQWAKDARAYLADADAADHITRARARELIVRACILTRERHESIGPAGGYTEAAIEAGNSPTGCWHRAA